jgi:hypothetical protein
MDGDDVGGTKVGDLRLGLHWSSNLLERLRDQPPGGLIVVVISLAASS